MKSSKKKMLQVQIEGRFALFLLDESGIWGNMR